MLASGGKESVAAENIDMLRDFAVDAGLKNIEFPQAGTAAYARLWDVCKEYSKEVHLETTSRETDVRESQSRRRQLHNQLCIMVFGLDHAAAGKRNPEDLKRVANLAHLVSGREQYVQK